MVISAYDALKTHSFVIDFKFWKYNSGNIFEILVFFFSCNRDTDWRFAATTLNFPRYSAPCWKNSCDAIIQHSLYIATTNLLLLTAKNFLISSSLVKKLLSSFDDRSWKLLYFIRLFFIYLLIVLFFFLKIYLSLFY